MGVTFFKIFSFCWPGIGICSTLYFYSVILYNAFYKPFISSNIFLLTFTDMCIHLFEKSACLMWHVEAKRFEAICVELLPLNIGYCWNLHSKAISRYLAQMVISTSLQILEL